MFFLFGQRHALQAAQHHSLFWTICSTWHAAAPCCKRCFAHAKPQARTGHIRAGCQAACCKPLDPETLHGAAHTSTQRMPCTKHAHNAWLPSPSCKPFLATTGAGASVAFVLISSTPWSSRAFLDGCSPGSMPLVTLPAYTQQELEELVTRVVSQQR